MALKSAVCFDYRLSGMQWKSAILLIKLGYQPNRIWGLIYILQRSDSKVLLHSYNMISSICCAVSESRWTPCSRRLLCLLLSTGVCSNSYPMNQWCYLTVSSSASPFSFCLQSFPASGPFPMSRLFISGDQSIGVWASASVLPINIDFL